MSLYSGNVRNISSNQTAKFLLRYETKLVIYEAIFFNSIERVVQFGENFSANSLSGVNFLNQS